MVWKDVVDRGMKNHEIPSSECDYRRMSGDYLGISGAITNKNGQDKSSCTLSGLCRRYRICCYMKKSTAIEAILDYLASQVKTFPNPNGY
jgi:hypothetical protein